MVYTDVIVMDEAAMLKEMQEYFNETITTSLIIPEPILTSLYGIPIVKNVSKIRNWRRIIENG